MNTKTDGISSGLLAAAWLSTDCIGERYLCFSKPRDNDPCETLVRLSDAEAIISKQAERIKALEADADEEAYIRDRMAQLLAETAVALKGPEKALHRHGWQDLPEAAIKLRAELAHAKLFAPAQRTERTPEPVNAVGPLNEAYWFGLEAAEKDFDVFGKPYQEVTS